MSAPAPAPYASLTPTVYQGRSFTRRATAVVSAGGLLVGFGVAFPSAAIAVTSPPCDPSLTVTQAEGPAAIQAIIDSGTSLVCISGPIVLTQPITVDSDVTFIGVSGGALDGAGSTGLIQEVDGAAVVTVRNLELRNGLNFVGGAISATSVTAIDSVFRGNVAAFGGAIEAQSVTVSGSTFDSNSAEVDGGAIRGYGLVSVDASTFVDNTAGTYGGAIRAESSIVRNSTFVGNTAGAEGGALFAGASLVQFSTFLNNTVEPSLQPNSADLEPSNGVLAELPGDSIYLAVTDGEVLTIRGNIFAGDGVNAQLGVGVIAPEPAPGVISDLGGNVFSTTALTEANFAAPDASTQFGKTPTQIFGAGAALGNNGGSTQTLPLIVGSPAIDAVPALLGPIADQNFAPAAAGDLTVDQRGVARTGLLDAGSFEFTAEPELAATGAYSGAMGGLSAVAALLLGLGAAIVAGIRRSVRR